MGWEKFEAEDELYDACVAFYDLDLCYDNMESEEAKLAKSLCKDRLCKAYTKALSLIGFDCAEAIIAKAQRDCEEDN